MKTRLVSLVGLSLLVIGQASAGVAEPQRGGRGASGGSSRGASSVSRGSGGFSRSSGGFSRSSGSFSRSSGSFSRSASSQGSRGSAGSYSRPSGGSSLAPSRSSTTVRPSSPPSVRPSQGGSIGGGATSQGSSRPGTSILGGSSTTRSILPSHPPSVGSSSGSPTGPLAPDRAGTAPGATPSGDNGRQIYERFPGTGSPSPDGSGGALAPDSENPGVSIPPARTQPRVRFPSAYSPAGTTTRSPSGARASGSSLTPRSATPGTSSAAPSGKGANPKGAIGKPGSGPLVRYDHGPSRRTDPRSVATPSAGSKTTAPPTRDMNGKSAKVADPKKTSTSIAKWRDVRRSDPKKAGEISAATRTIARVHDTAVGVAAGSIGGVVPDGYHGGDGHHGDGHYDGHHGGCDDDWVCDPWGWSWGVYWGWGAWSCWWSYPCYWGWYYPLWWCYSYPYYYNAYAYYPAVSSVVYAEPQVVYVEQPQEVVGEGVVQAQPAAPAPAPENALSIAAQRYLDLGDRAFREGRYTDAVQFYAKAVEFAPDQGALYLVLADALFAAGDYHYGAYAIRRALELDPALIDSQIDKHGFYHDPSLFDEQLVTLERYLDNHGGDRDARLVLALNYLFGGRPADAVRTLESPSAAMTDDQAAQRILVRARQLIGG